VARFCFDERTGWTSWLQGDPIDLPPIQFSQLDETELHVLRLVRVEGVPYLCDSGVNLSDWSRFEGWEVDGGHDGQEVVGRAR